MLTCIHCGHVGADVTERLNYEGGVGYIWRDLCGDRSACWQRWEGKEGLKHEGRPVRYTGRPCSEVNPNPACIIAREQERCKMFRVLSKHPRLGSFVLRWPVAGIRYSRYLWCQRRPVGVFADVIGLRRVV